MNIELPTFTVQEAEKDSLIVSSICLSLGSTKFIYDLIIKNLEDIKHFNESFYKYITRVQYYVENKDSTVVYNDIFHPTYENFKYEEIHGTKLNKEDFENAVHYIMFQDIHINELQGDDIQFEKWQHCLVNLLLETDLSAYCSNNSNSSRKSSMEKIGNKKNTITELVWQIHKAPTNYLVDSDKAGKVKVMAYFLAKYFQTSGEEDTMKELEILRNHFAISVENFMERQQKVEQSLRLTINSLKNKISNLKTQASYYNSTVIQCKLARWFISQYTCSYSITKTATNITTPKSSEKRSVSCIVKPDTGKFTISFIEPDKKMKSPKKSQPLIKEQSFFEYFLYE